jgi:archaellum component FlaF (FlaF/FlaG flagellin family)
MAKTIHHRHVGDTEVAIAATLQRPDETAVDVTSCTVRFKVVSTGGVVKVAESDTNVTVTDAANGQVQYNPQSADVDTAGIYWAYFTVEDASNNTDTFPAKQGDLEIVFHADG